MKSPSSMIALLSFAALFGFSAGRAGAAEGFVQISVGGAFTEDADFDVDGLGVITDVEFEDSVSIDVGGGAWFSPTDFLDLGVQGGIGYFRPTVETISGFDDLEFHLVPFSVLGMARIPLFKSDRLPHGIIQPYAGIGPTFLLSFLEIDEVGIDASAVGFDVGFDLRAGVNVNLTHLLGLFVEYKRTEVDATLTDGSDDLDVDFATDHITAGLGFHF